MAELLEAIPDFQTLMLPVLQYAYSNPQGFRNQDATIAMTQVFNLSPEQARVLQTKGRQTIIQNRVSWAMGYLRKAGMLIVLSRGIYTISEQGKTLLAEKPVRIDMRVLRRYGEFRKIEGMEGLEQAPEVSINLLEEQLDPQEVFNNQYQFILQKTADELLDLLKRTTPSFFERLVENLLIQMGYGGSGEALRRSLMQGSSDEGIDAIIQEDVLGLSSIYVQAKRYRDSSIGRPIVQAFAGSMDRFHATKGVLITTSSFSHAAKEYIQHIGKTIILIDGPKLVELMLQYEVGVTASEPYKIYSINTEDYELVPEKLDNLS